MKENFWQAWGLQGGCQLAHAALPSVGDRCLKQAQWIFSSAESICCVVETRSISQDKDKRLGASFSSSLLNRATHSCGIPRLPEKFSLCGCQAFVLI